MFLLVVLLLLAVAFAAYQFSEAKRWHTSSQKLSTDLDLSQKTALEAEVKSRLLLQSQAQLEEKFRAMAAEALQSNSQLFSTAAATSCSIWWIQSTRR